MQQAQGCQSVFANHPVAGAAARRALLPAAGVLLAAVLSACAPAAPSTSGAVVATGEAALASSASGARAATQALAAVAPAPVDMQRLADPVLALEDDLAWPEVDQKGVASWYGPGFHGRKTANGERYNQYELTAAHRKYAFNTQLCVRNAGNGKTVVVRVNDRGPYVGQRVIDLSKAAAEEIGMLQSGVKHVEIYKLEEGEESCPEALQQAAVASRD